MKICHWRWRNRPDLSEIRLIWSGTSFKFCRQSFISAGWGGKTWKVFGLTKSFLDRKNEKGMWGNTEKHNGIIFIYFKNVSEWKISDKDFQYWLIETFNWCDKTRIDAKTPNIPVYCLVNNILRRNVLRWVNISKIDGLKLSTDLLKERCNLEEYYAQPCSFYEEGSNYFHSVWKCLWTDASLRIINWKLKQSGASRQLGSMHSMTHNAAHVWRGLTDLIQKCLWAAAFNESSIERVMHPAGINALNNTYYAITRFLLLLLFWEVLLILYWTCLLM